MIPVTRIRLPSSSLSMCFLASFLSVAHAQAAVDRYHRAGDVTGVLGGQEADHTRDLLDAADPLQRDGLQRGFLLLLVERAGHGGVDEARRDDVGGDRPRSQLTGER